ncbi:MAG: SDR family oxidoreductase [Gorillibacterium sp.]|nr:SDR family oxidoreductase [Gorillibacterium sp.]
MTEIKRMEGKVAIITGGGSGIGREAAIVLARHGARVCIMDLGEIRANEAVQQIMNEGGEAFVVDVDISDPKRVEDGFQQAIKRYGQLDFVFANAGINGTIAPIEELTVEEWNKTLNTNLMGTFLTVKYAIPYLKVNGGSILITSSINGNRSFSMFGASAYSTSKAGQVAFMQMAALELARYKIRVNAICPGAISTNIDQNTSVSPEVEKIQIPVHYPQGSQPLEGGPGTPEQVADLVLFFACKESSHVTGTPIYIDGAESRI